MDEQNRNLILAVALSALVMLVWMVWFAPEPTTPPQGSPEATQSADGTMLPPTAGTPDGTQAAVPDTADETEAAAARVSVDTPRLRGSISLQGGRIDDLELKDYKETLDTNSPLVRLLSPVGSEFPYFAVYGWAPGGDLPAEDVPGPSTTWTLESGSTLGVDSPILLRWANDNGLIFHREISVDEDYMFTVTQRVENTGDTAVRLAPYGLIERRTLPKMQNFFVLHEGIVRLNDDELNEIKYKNMSDMPVAPREGGARAESVEVAENGWIGFTDKNWMTTLVPEPGQGFRSVAKYSDATGIYQAYVSLPTQEVAPGASVSDTTMLFAGAKEWEAIRDYQSGGIKKFIDSIDWGWFYFLTKPIFTLLHWLNGVIGNMGWSIIALTLILKAVLFPLAYKSYVSMARMKELQPEMEKLKEKFGDDRAAMQKATMTLYREQKVNPAAGCLPLILQIPIFFSLYKVIFVTIELRHAPWLAWIRDLSAPDPSSILNLFGLLNTPLPSLDSPLHFISLGVLPILLGISMWLQQKLNPAPTDKSQAMIFAWMPWVFMFMLGTFASGLVLYWITNNTITFIQQYIIMRSHGHRPDVLGNITKTFRRKKSTDGAK